MKALEEAHVFHMLNPDTNQGGGYGKITTGQQTMGHADFPYGWEEEDKWDEEKEAADQQAYEDVKDVGMDDPGTMQRFSNKVGNAYLSPDPAGRHAYDRKSFIDGETRGISSESIILLRRLIAEDAFRLRGASSEPESLGTDAWPGATPPKFPFDEKERRWTLKSVMLNNEDQLDRYAGEGDPDDPEERFRFQEATYE